MVRTRRTVVDDEHLVENYTQDIIREVMRLLKSKNAKAVARRYLNTKKPSTTKKSVISSAKKSAYYSKQKGSIGKTSYMSSKGRISTAMTSRVPSVRKNQAILDKSNMVSPAGSPMKQTHLVSLDSAEK